MDRWTFIRSRAAEILAEYEAKTGKPAFESTGSHVILADLSEQLFHLTVIADESMEPAVQGSLNPLEGTITHQPHLSPEKTAFVVAHEIGHHVLTHPPRDFQCSAAGVIEDGEPHINDEPYAGALVAQDGVYRAYNSRDQWELEANVFAAELLAPTHRVIEKITATPDWTVEALAAYFGLTKGAMSNQVAAAVLSRPVVEENLNSEETMPDTGTAPGLDDAQQEAAYVPLSKLPALIVAGPGAGKTRVLTERFIFLVRQNIDPRRILALTFSNKAAAEMRERLCAALPEREHEVQVFTFHSLGLHLLMQYGTNIGLKPNPKILSPADAFVLLRANLSQMPLGNFERLPFPTQHISPLLAAVSRAKDEMRSPEDLRDLSDNYMAEVMSRAAPSDEAAANQWEEDKKQAALYADLAAFYEAYQALLRAESYVDYGDLIVEAVRLFDLPHVAETIRSQYDHILVDEFQDVNYASGRLVQALDGMRDRVWAVGDPRQSIYGFRGASRANIESFTITYPKAHVFKLDVNYRSVPDIVQAGQAVPFPIPLCGTSLIVPKLKANRGRPAPGPAVHFGIAADTDVEMATITRLVREQLEEFRPSQIAILCRTGNQTRRVSDTLEKKGIPTNWSGKLEDRPPFRDLMGVLLLAIDNPQGIVRLARHPEHFFNEVDLRLLLQTSKVKGHSALAALYAAAAREISGLSEEGCRQAEQMKALALKLRRQKNAWSVLATYLFEEARWTRAFFTDDALPQRRYLATTGQLADMAREFSLKGSVSGEADTAAFVDYVRSCLESGNLECSDSTNAMPNAVTVMTIHKSKGLEWPVVMVPSLNSSTGHNRDSVALPPRLLREGSEPDEAYEEACVFYVAFTRARDRLFLTRAHKSAQKIQKPLPFLHEFIDQLTPTGFLGSLTFDTRSPENGPPSENESSAFEVTVPWDFSGPITYRALDSYDRCGQRFKYDYVYGLQGAESGYILFRRSLYPVLEWIAEQVGSGQLVADEAIQQKLDEEWSEAQFKENQFSEFYRRRAYQVASAFAQRMTPGVQTLIRQKRTVVIGDENIEIVVDEIENSSPRIFRVHKFGNPAKNDKERSLLALLPLANEGQGEPEIRLHYLHSGQEEICASRPIFNRNRREKVARLREDIALGKFAPKPGDWCSSCPHNLICPA